MSNGIDRRRRCAWLFAVLFLALSFSAGAGEPPVDRLSVPGPLRLDGMEFHLAWSAGQPPTFYKHEYLPPGQTLERYRQMLMLDFLVADAVPASLALRKIEELRQRRETDPTVHYDVLLKDDGSAVLLDFTLSGQTDDGTAIIEWNAYRYEAVPGGVVLLGISRRGYGQDDGRRFLAEELAENRQAWINELAGMDLPAVAPVR